MKSIKLYLNFALSIAFCASLNTFGMEPIGESNTSSESGIETKDEQLLKRYIKKLQIFDKMIITGLKDQDISNEERKTLIQLLHFVNKTIITANDMVLGLIPVNANFINEKIRIINMRWNQK